MEINGKKVLLCDCEGTMRLDGKALATACGAGQPGRIHTQLCRAQLDAFRGALAEGGPFVVACTQEAPLFDETAAEAASDTAITYTNIRERAGWSAEATAAMPKIAALLAEATVDITAAPSVTLRSEGVCLVYGHDEGALEAAQQLASRLDVTVLLSRPDDVIPPQVMKVPIFRGTIVAAKGHLGAFEITVDDYAPLVVSSRESLVFGPPKNGAQSRCDLILDLTGDAPLFPAAERRDGYFNPDPGNPAAVQRALFDIADLVGEFEKPRYVDFNSELCAHSRSGKTGCTRCLDVCPAAAIRPTGDHVEIDPFLCGGCGSCNSVCPTGAASYTLPRGEELLERLRMLLTTYHRAGGERATVLVHDEAHGSETISLMSRFGRGLPASVLPFVVNEVTQIGFEFLISALAYGAARVVVLADPKRRDELSGLASQIGLVEAVMAGLGYGSGRVTTLIEQDPEATETQLFELPDLDAPTPGTFLPVGGRRAVARLALAHLHANAPEPVELLALPAGAPYGAVVVDTENCTLCLACVGACPADALLDNPDMPQLRFREEACIQCGLCRVTCPEKVIRLEPRINFAGDARDAVVIKEEEPFRCIRCGKPFGTRSSIERIVEQLAGKHAMFRDQTRIDRIRMCDDCRVVAQFEAGDDPFRGPPRPLTRTSEDYLREPEIEEARKKVLAERGGEIGEGKRAKEDDDPQGGASDPTD